MVVLSFSLGEEWFGLSFNVQEIHSFVDPFLFDWRDFLLLQLVDLTLRQLRLLFGILIWLLVLLMLLLNGCMDAWIFIQEKGNRYK